MRRFLEEQGNALAGALVIAFVSVLAIVVVLSAPEASGPGCPPGQVRERHTFLAPMIAGNVAMMLPMDGFRCAPASPVRADPRMAFDGEKPAARGDR